MKSVTESLDLSVQGERLIGVNPNDYPWIDDTATEIQGQIITLQNEVSFTYGSLIAHNHTVSKLASKVSLADSQSVQQSLFMGLPDILNGRPRQDIGKVENVHITTKTLFTASKNLLRSPTLVFSVDYSELPTVLRLGVSQPRDLKRLLGVFGIKQASGSRRKS